MGQVGRVGRTLDARGLRRRLGGTALLVLAGAGTFVAAQSGPAAAPCVLTGTVTSGGTPLPGVSIVLSQSGTVAAASSTDEHGAFRVRVSPGEYAVTAQMAAFAPHEGTLSLDGGSGTCGAVLDITLTLASRSTAAPAGPIIDAPGLTRRPARLGGRGPSGAPGDGGQRFAALQVLQVQSAAAAGSGDVDDADPATRLLPPGFSTNAATDVVAVIGIRREPRSRPAARSARRDRPRRLRAARRRASGGCCRRRGLRPRRAWWTWRRWPGRGWSWRWLRAWGRSGRLRRAWRAERRWRRVPRTRPRQQRVPQGSTTYTFGGSALDAAPYPLRGPQTTPDYMRQQFGGSVGGPLRIPGVYDGARTTYFVNYNGGRADNFVDQYATVPTAAMRAGDFSGLSRSARSAHRPAVRRRRDSGGPHRSGRARAARLHSAAQPRRDVAELPPFDHLGDDERRHQRAPHAQLRSHAAARTRRARWSRRRGRARRPRRFRPRRQRGRAERAGAVPARPVGRGQRVSAARRRHRHLVALGADRASTCCAGAPSTTCASRPPTRGPRRERSSPGCSTRPAPPASPASRTTRSTGACRRSRLPGCRACAVSRQRDAPTRVCGADYTFTRPSQRHTLRLGGGFRHDNSDGRTVSDARGAFVFTGLYTSGGGVVARGSGLDFADFLLGMPQQASVGFGPGDVAAARRSASTCSRRTTGGPART